MQKTPIKRVKRVKKAATTKQKIIAGAGVAGSLLGGVSAGAAQNKPVTPIVSSNNKQSGDNLIKKAQNLISRYFKVNEAKAYLGSEEDYTYDEQNGLNEFYYGNFGGGGGGWGGDYGSSGDYWEGYYDDSWYDNGESDYNYGEYGSSGDNSGGSDYSNSGSQGGFGDTGFDGMAGNEMGDENTPPDIGNQSNSGLSTETQNIINQTGNNTDTSYNSNTSATWQQELQDARNAGAVISSDGSTITYLGPDGQVHNYSFDEFSNGGEAGVAYPDQAGLSDALATPDGLGNVTGDTFDSTGNPQNDGSGSLNDGSDSGAITVKSESMGAVGPDGTELFRVTDDQGNTFIQDSQGNLYEIDVQHDDNITYKQVDDVADNLDRAFAETPPPANNQNNNNPPSIEDVRQNDPLANQILDRTNDGTVNIPGVGTGTIWHKADGTWEVVLTNGSTYSGLSSQSVLELLNTPVPEIVGPELSTSETLPPPIPANPLASTNVPTIDYYTGPGQATTSATPDMLTLNVPGYGEVTATVDQNGNATFTDNGKTVTVDASAIELFSELGPDMPTGTANPAVVNASQQSQNVQQTEISSNAQVPNGFTELGMGYYQDENGTIYTINQDGRMVAEINSLDTQNSIVQNQSSQPTEGQFRVSSNGLEIYEDGDWIAYSPYVELNEVKGPDLDKIKLDDIEIDGQKYSTTDGVNYFDSKGNNAFTYKEEGFLDSLGNKISTEKVKEVAAKAAENAKTGFKKATKIASEKLKGFPGIGKDAGKDKALPVTNIFKGSDGTWTKRVVINGQVVNVDETGSAWDDSGRTVNLTDDQLASVNAANKVNTQTFDFDLKYTSTDKAIDTGLKIARYGSFVVGPAAGIGTNWLISHMNANQQQSFSSWLASPGDGVMNYTYKDNEGKTVISSMTKSQYIALVGFSFPTP